MDHQNQHRDSNGQPVNSLSPLEVGQVVNSKDTLYEALVRNQVHCPKYKDLIMTTEFMQRV